MGHGAVMEGCRLEDFAYVGMNAAVLDGCVMEEGSLLAAGGVLKDGDRIPAWTLAAGVPAKPRKRLEGAILEEVRGGGSRVYQKLMKLYENLGVSVSGAGDGNAERVMGAQGVPLPSRLPGAADELRLCSGGEEQGGEAGGEESFHGRSG